MTLALPGESDSWGLAGRAIEERIETMSKRNGKLPDGMIRRGAVYWADFRAGGRRIRKSLSRNLKTARQLLIELRARAERGDYGLLDNDYPMEDLRAEYLRHCEQTKKPATVKRYKDNLGAILPAMPSKVSQITIQTVLAYRKQRLAEVSPQTITWTSVPCRQC
jgi:hypothetical protein